MRIAAAIACARDDAPLGEVLDAVLAQAGAVTVALATDARVLEPVAVARGARIVHARGPGIAAARNAALASCDEDVLALLDDDVRPEPGWFAAHARVWRDAHSDLAIVGGPIVPRVIGDRPRWLADDLLGVFGAVDHRSPSRPIDGITTRALGGNMSVRIDAVAGLGGLWPMRGEPALRGWYNSEALLQHHAAEAGWQVQWLAEAGAMRLVDGQRLDRRRMLMLRSLHGALIGAVGRTRRRSLAFRQVVTSTLGVPIALLAGSETRAINRLARAAENAGVIAGSGMAARRLEPTGPTEFRPSVPLPASRRASHRRSSDAAVVLMYHRVADNDHDPLGLCVSRRNFAEHTLVLKGRTVVPLHELATAVRRGRVPRGVAAISFDDGYRDNLVNAAPALQAAGLPATVFVATGHVASGAPFVWDVVADALLGPGARPPSLALDIGRRRMCWRTDSPRARELAHVQLQAWLRTLSATEAGTLVTSLNMWSKRADATTRQPLTVTELETLATCPGITIGAHSQRHLSLARQDDETCRAELSGSRDDVADWLGTRPYGIAYPFGVPGEDVNERTASRARAAGYDHGVVNAPGVVCRSSDPMTLPRIAVPDVAGEAFERMLDGALAGRA